MPSSWGFGHVMFWSSLEGEEDTVYLWGKHILNGGNKKFPETRMC